jgi:DNA-binding transcriptional MerR regulator
VDEQTGYRYYDINQNARLDMIAYMKELGMSLSQIRDALEQEDMSLIEEILSQKNEQIHQQMRDLKAQHDAVERAILSIERYRKSPVTGTFSLEYIDQRYVWGVPCADNFYSDDIHS